VTPITRRGWTLGVLLLAVWMVSMWAPSTTPPASAANVAVSQCNGTDNVGGRAVQCDVTVVNNLDLATGVTSSTLTLRVCSGAAGAMPTCVTT